VLVEHGGESLAIGLGSGRVLKEKLLDNSVEQGVLSPSQSNEVCLFLCLI